MTSTPLSVLDLIPGVAATSPAVALAMTAAATSTIDPARGPQEPKVIAVMIHQS
jgi:hypothetical protein